MKNVTVIKLRRVRTPAGAKRYKLPIGSPIVDRPAITSIRTKTDGGKLLERLRADGGFTMNPRRWTDQQHGIAVATTNIPPLVKPIKTIKSSDIEAWIKKNQVPLAKRDTRIGAWVDESDGNVYLDVVSIFHDRDKAVAAGKKNNQIAVFDLDTFTEIPTGGDGVIKRRRKIKLHLFQPGTSPDEILRAIKG